MDKLQEDFLRELLNDFKIEAAEHQHAIVNGLLELEKSSNLPADKSIIEVIFREIHSMKGAARAVNLSQIEQLCMAMENVFHEIKNEKLKVVPQMFDTFYKAADFIDRLIIEIDSKQKTVSENEILNIKNGLDNLRVKSNQGFNMQAFSIHEELKKQTSKPEKTSDIVENELIKPVAIKEESVPSERIADKQVDVSANIKSTATETVRVATSKLYDLLRQAEEMITIKTILDYQVSQIQNAGSEFGLWRRKNDDIHESKVIANENTDVKEIELEAHNKAFFKKHEDLLFKLSSNLEQVQRSAARSIDEILIDIKKTLMYPFSNLLTVVPKIVRDLSKEYNKEIELIIEGGEIEIDRRILEEMKDPLIHLIRNCIDHGIETKEDRLKTNKPEKGKLQIQIRQNLSQKIELLISDDGAGINKERLIKSAIKNGTTTAEELKKMSDNEIHMLVFASGISTKSFVTDISGRGLGMAIVAENVAKINGTIEIETKQGHGTTFTITLPQTMAAFRGIVVKSFEKLFVIPTSVVVRAIRIKPIDIKTVESKRVIQLNNETLSLVNLGDVLGLSQRRAERNRNSILKALVLQLSQKKIVFIIDELLGEHEGVVKNLSQQLKHVKNIAGATLLGNGKIVPILQIHELMESAAKTSITNNIVMETTTINDKNDTGIQYILIAEDSITVRNMLRSFVETAGYKVKTAVDGSEAFDFLQKEHFDLVVSDVEMPKMNGFELTARIKADRNLEQTPVILVTALDSAEDRQRGLEAGANAYIVKGSFEKSNLIETIKRLI